MRIDERFLLLFLLLVMISWFIFYTPNMVLFLLIVLLLLVGFGGYHFYWPTRYYPQRWLLTIDEPGHARRSVVVGRGGFWVGRSSRCHIRLGDPRASRRHAWIGPAGRYGDSLMVRDGHSRTGTFLNGSAVHEASVHEGDEVRIGDTRLWLSRYSERRGRYD